MMLPGEGTFLSQMRWIMWTRYVLYVYMCIILWWAKGKREGRESWECVLLTNGVVCICDANLWDLNHVFSAVFCFYPEVPVLSGNLTETEKCSGSWGFHYMFYSSNRDVKCPETRRPCLSRVRKWTWSQPHPVLLVLWAVGTLPKVRNVEGQT